MSSCGIQDVGEVGGKNASLGEMIQHLEPRGIRVPHGFVVTATGYRHFLKETRLAGFVEDALRGLDTKNLDELNRRGKLIREKIRAASFPGDLKQEIAVAYKDLEKRYGKAADVAVRSSATAEDLPGASFAGEHETYLNIRGEGAVLRAIRSAMASLFTDRAISYRVDKGFDHLSIALSVGVQKMVRSDLASSGVMFTLDTESGFPGVVVINGAWGLGEMIVQGEVTPDEFLVFKKTGALISKKLGAKKRKMIYSSGAHPTKIVSVNAQDECQFVLREEEIRKLAQWGMQIEEHYSKRNKKWTPMDIEWAKDGKTGELFIVQARPETIHADRDFTRVKEYRLGDGHSAKPIVIGASVGSKIAAGKARVILDVKNVRQFKAGEVLVTDMTDPDWEPIMKIAAAIVTDKGGRTSHAAIVSRELGIPCIVGTEAATRKIKTGEKVTVDASASEGSVYRGMIPFKIVEHDTKKIQKPQTHIMMNIATPDTAFEKSFLPNDGVGLAREEFIIASNIGIHPMALLDKKIKTEQPAVWRKIEERIAGWKDGETFYVDNLAYGIAKIGAAFYPKPVIVRFSDFKTNEYRTLVGGDLYEPEEENPMIGWRGASRYYHSGFAPAFALECRAIKKVREDMGFENVAVMIPFCRTVDEGKKVVAMMAKNGLRRKTPRNSPKSNDLKIFAMAEIPSNVVLADKFLDVFDGMSIGSNDLAQLTLGIDRDAGSRLRGIADERDLAVRDLVAQVIKACKRRKKYVGICGDAPSTFPDFAEFLIEQGIESMSLNPDIVVPTSQMVWKKEQELKRKSNKLRS